MIGKFVIVKNDFSEYFKDLAGNVLILETMDDAYNHCGIYELVDVLILEIKAEYSDEYK